MKIAIITYFDTTNYGANLQAFALQREIQNLGYDVETVNYIPYNIKVRELPYINIKGTLRNFLGSVVRYHRINIKYRQLHKFVKKNDVLSKQYCKKDLPKTNCIYNKFIVGSDILWSLTINGEDMSFFLDFVADNSKKYSYATSIGTKWSTHEMELVKPYLQKFRKISVREKIAIDWVYRASGQNAELVCDPTMLLDEKEWSQFCVPNKQLKPYILIYMPTNKCIDDARAFGSSMGYEVVAIDQNDGIEEFLTKIKNAKFVFTGSYHGFLFSIYFHRNLAYYIFQDGSRLEYLSELFDLDNHNFTEQMFSVPDAPNWQKIDESVSEFRKKSVNYLKEILEE